MSKNNAALIAKMKARAAASSEGGGGTTIQLPQGVKIHKPKVGVEIFDVIPYTVTDKRNPKDSVGDLVPYRTYSYHGNVGPQGEMRVCPSTINKPCPVCEEHTKLRRDADANEDEVKALRKKDRQLFNIRMKGSKEIEVMDMSYYNFGKLLDDEINADENNEGAVLFGLPQGGKSIKVRWVEASMGTRKFIQAKRIDFVDRADLGDKILAKAVDLDKALKLPTYDELEEAFHGTGSQDEDEDESDATEDEDEETTTKKNPGKGKKPAAKDEDDEDSDEDEEDSESDEDEEEAKPAKGKKSKAKSEDDEDEDEEEDKDTPPDDEAEDSDDDDDDGDEDEDEDEEEKPAKGKKGKKPAAKDEDDEDDESDGDEDDDSDSDDEDDDDKSDESDDEDEDEGDEEDDDDEDEVKPAKGKGVKCSACNGTGKNSRGKMCIACSGTGVKPAKK